jgi:hypothetical protein
MEMVSHPAWEMGGSFESAQIISKDCECDLSPRDEKVLCDDMLHWYLEAEYAQDFESTL